MAERLYLDDIQVGTIFRTGSVTVTEAAMRAFAEQFDPQPFHLDATQAATSVFGQLVASGWHTAALTMRLIVDSPFQPVGGQIGLGIEQIQWPRPVVPNDTLHAVSEIVAVRPSQSRTDRGVAQVRTTTLNQRDEAVLIMTATLLMQRRPINSDAAPHEVPSST